MVGVTAIIGSFRGGGIGAFVFGAVSVLIGLLVLLNAQFSTELLITLFAVLLLIDGVAGVYLGIKKIPQLQGVTHRDALPAMATSPAQRAGSIPRCPIS